MVAGIPDDQRIGGAGEANSSTRESADLGAGVADVVVRDRDGRRAGDVDPVVGGFRNAEPVDRDPASPGEDKAVRLARHRRARRSREDDRRVRSPRLRDRHLLGIGAACYLNRLSGNDLPGCSADRAERQTLGARARVRAIRVRAVDVERRGTRCQRGRLWCHPQDDSDREERTGCRPDDLPFK